MSKKLVLMSLTIAIACLGAVLTSCDSTEHGSSPSTLPTPPGFATLAVSPTNWSFGQVAVGVNSSKSITLTNTGIGTVTVSGADIIASGYSVSGITFPRSLPAGVSTTATINFAPSAPGRSAGSVSFVSNANESPAVVSVSGTGFGPAAHTVDLGWNASPSAVDGYRVYRSSVSGVGYELISSSLVPEATFTDHVVISGQTFFYVVTSVDAQGVESVFSNEAMAAIPIP